MLGEIFGVDGVVVLIVVMVVLFGGSAIPKLARNLGSAKNEFEKGFKETSAAGSGARSPSSLVKDVPTTAIDEPGPLNAK